MKIGKLLEYLGIEEVKVLDVKIKSIYNPVQFIDAKLLILR